MHPIVCELPFFTLRSYGVMAALAFLLATLLTTLNRKTAGMTVDEANTSVFIAVLGGVAGARIFYVIQFYEQFRGRFWEIFRIDRGGLVFYGGFFLAFVLLVWYLRRHKLDVVRSLDIFASAVAGGHALGRIGCFLNGCCFGRVTETALGVVYPPESIPFMKYGSLPLHPVQLYEALANGLLAIVFFFMARKTKRGVTMSCYILSYGLLRFLDEFFRGDHARITSEITVAQWIGLGLIPAGGLLLWHFLRKPAAPPLPAAEKKDRRK